MELCIIILYHINNKKCSEEEILAFRNIWKCKKEDLKNSSSLEFASILIKFIRHWKIILDSRI